MMPLIHYIRSYPSFPSVIPVHMASSLRVTHPSAMITFYRSRSSHRLACVKHSVSVHPEPGSNSSFNSCYFLLHLILYPFLTSLLLLLMFSLSSPIRIDKINIITLTSTMSTTFLLFFLLFLSPPSYLQYHPPFSISNTIYCVVRNKKRCE